MQDNRIVLSNGALCCVHIDKADLEAIGGFQIANENGGFLADYLKSFALNDERNRRARTYLVYNRVTDELVAYFSLKAGFVAVNEVKGIFQRSFDVEPGVELANFAVNGVYRENHPELSGAGIGVFRSFVLPTAAEAAAYIGIRILYIFALPYSSLISYYEKLGFLRLNKIQERDVHRRIKPRYDRGCVFMYQVI